VDAAVAELGADPARLYLCGFSQGAYLAHCAAVRAPGRVAGWIAQSGRLKLQFLAPWMAAVAGKPVLIQHGRDDPHLPPGAADHIAAALTRHGARVTLQLYDSGHAIDPAMADACRLWLGEQAPAGA
jgi:predicted esterase